MGTLAKHAPTQGNKSRVTVALLPKGRRNRPTPIVITLGAGVTKAAVTSTVTITGGSSTEFIEAGQFLLFVEPTTGNEKLVQVSARTATNATAIPIDAADEAIVSGAVAVYPVEFYDRTGADFDQSFNLAEVSTFNTGGNRDGVVTGGSADVDLPGIYYHYDAGFQTVSYAAANNREVWLEVEYTPPNDNFTKGEIKGGAIAVTSRGIASPEDGFVTADIGAAILGSLFELKATPV